MRTDNNIRHLKKSCSQQKMQCFVFFPRIVWSYCFDGFTPIPLCLSRAILRSRDVGSEVRSSNRNLQLLEVETFRKESE